MRINELLSESVFRNAESKVLDRFEKLGLGTEVADYFLNWVYHGQFNLPYSKLDKFEAAFYAIRSVLPDSVIQSYNKLPVVYRGMSFSPTKLQQINSGGLPIKSRIMAWTPYLKAATEYIKNAEITTGVVLKHKPVASDVVLAMNPETEDFLHLNKFIVANPGEAILSLPILNITPEIVVKVID